LSDRFLLNQFLKYNLVVNQQPILSQASYKVNNKSFFEYVSSIPQ